MRRNGRGLGAGLGLLLLIGPRVVSAQGPAIDHNAVACVVAEKFAGFEARFSPAENVSRARIYFRAEGGQFWYFIDMKPQGGAFQGVIPKPKKSSRRINYYIDVMDKAFAESRTQEYAPEVVRDAGVCSKKMAVASIASSASVTVGASPGAPAIPAGFSASGVVPVGATGATAGAAAGTTAGAAAAVGAAGGLSGAAIAGIAIGGAAAVAAGVALATHKSNPAATTLPTGTFAGTLSGFTQTITHIGGPSPGIPPYNCTTQEVFPPDPFTLTITDPGGAGALTLNPHPYGTTGTPANFCASANSGITGPGGVDLQATVSGATVTVVSTPTPVGRVWTLHGTRGGNGINGTFTVVGGTTGGVAGRGVCFNTDTTCTASTGSGTFTATKQ